MKPQQMLFVIVTFFLVLSIGFLLGCDCGDDDDDDSGGVSGDDDDDTTPDDDDDNDDNDNDDNNDDDNDNDDDNNDTDYDKPDWYCDVPDPEGIGAGNLVGGGSITDTIKVYVYNDNQCVLLDGVTVLYNGVEQTEVSTGYYEITTIAPGEAEVTAFKADYLSWTYKVDAKVMYFRLRPTTYGRTYSDSPESHFKQNGNPISLSNPNIQNVIQMVQLFTNPIYFGVAFPGVSRETFLSTDLDGIITQGNFQLDYTFPDTDETAFILLPDNVYLPSFNLDADVPFYGQVNVSGDHDSFAVPVDDNADEMSVEGLVMSVELGAAFDWDTLLDWIETPPADLAEIILELLPTLVHSGIKFPYIGAAPAWNTEGPADLRAVTVNPDNTYDLTISEPQEWWHYLAFSLAEIPNRAILPMGATFLLEQSKSADEVQPDRMGELPYGNLPSGDYLTAILKNDLYNLHMSSIALKYAEDISDWDDGIDLVDDADFLSLPDGWNSSYNSDTGTADWLIWDAMDPSDLEVDVYFVIHAPAHAQAIMAMIPGDETSFTYPMPGVEFSDDDFVVVIGFALPDSVDPTNFNPYEIFSYNHKSMTVWTNVNLLELLIEMFGGLLPI